MNDKRESIVNSNNSNIESLKYECPICKLEGIQTTLKSSTYSGLSTSESAHMKNKHNIKLSEIPPERRHNDAHLIAIYKAMKRMRKK